MKNHVKTFRLFVRSNKVKNRKIAEAIRKFNKNTNNPLIESDDADLVIAIGGDGTFIDAVTSTNFSKDIVYTGIHTGTLGFLQEFSKNDISTLMQHINCEQELRTRKVYIGSIDVFLKDGNILHFFALNEVLVCGDNFSKIEFGEYFHNELLQNVKSSGIIIATSTGDTAHSLNAGGAIDLSNNCQLVCTLIHPIQNAVYERFITNPIVCSKITLKLKSADNISIIIDGINKGIDSKNIEKVEVSMLNSNYINKLDLMGYSKVRVIREKILGYKVLTITERVFHPIKKLTQFFKLKSK